MGDAVVRRFASGSALTGGLSSPLVVAHNKGYDLFIEGFDSSLPNATALLHLAVGGEGSSQLERKDLGELKELAARPVER